MGLLDGLLKNAPAIAQLATSNPQILQAALALLSTRDASVGGTGGLGGLVSAFERNGLGSMIGSWIGTGPNPPITGSQLENALGSDVLGQFAQRAGIPAGQAGGALASVLPGLIDHLTPEGQMPEAGALEHGIGSLLGMLGGH
jgi:uncharacterized protein YidB (DUF937 family)